MTSYDSLNHITKIDTSVYIDINGDTIILFEKYTSDSKFFLFVNTLSDTNTTGVYSLNGNNLKICTSDSSNFFSIRTISQLDAENLELYQIFSLGSSKHKLLHKFLRL